MSFVSIFKHLSCLTVKYKVSELAVTQTDEEYAVLLPCHQQHKTNLLAHIYGGCRKLGRSDRLRINDEHATRRGSYLSITLKHKYPDLFND